MKEDTEIDSGEANDEDVKTPKEIQHFWCKEFQAADKRVESWHKLADQIKSRYLAEKRANNQSTAMGGDRSLNLFHSNVATLEAMLYGSIPTVSVNRRYADAADDVGRVAAEVMQRLLNSNLQDEEEDYDSILKSTCQDRLLSGLGVARVRYVVETELNEAGVEEMVSEDAPIDYYYWGDVRWGWCRSFAEMPWMAFCNYMTKKEVEKEFSEEVAEGLTYKERTVSTDGNEAEEDADQKSTTHKTEIWEIWDKETKTVYFFNKDAEVMLDTKPDPLGLTKFFPAPPFLIANTTTSLYQPRPDFMFSQELYNDIDILQTRITKLTTAVKAAGVYDAADDGIKRLMDEGTDNILIPVEKWAHFSEKGGIAGSVQWMPLGDIVNALDRLVAQRDANIQLLQQISGMADVMRGGLDNQYEGVGQTNTKEKYGSARVQSLHDQYSVFVSKLLRLKAEVISRHFSPQTILAKSNMEYSDDMEMVPKAVELIKQPEQARLQIAIKPESLAMVDFNRLQEERTMFMQGMSGFMQAAAPLIETDKSMLAPMLTVLQWTLAGFKGAQQIEGVIDKAIKQANEAAEAAKQQPPEPSPEEIKAKGAMEIEATKHSNAMEQIQAKAQGEGQTRQADLAADLKTTQMQSQTKIAEIEAASAASVNEMRIKARFDVMVESHQAQTNIAQTEAQSGAEIAKGAAEASNKINELEIKTEIAVKEAKEKEAVKPAPAAEKKDG